MTELEKMINGDLYDPTDEELKKLRLNAHHICAEYNKLFEDSDEIVRYELLEELLPNADEDIFIQGPFYCDYGFNIYVGKNFYANFNLTILDVCPVKIGENVMFGPNVSIMTPVHPMEFKLRNQIKEYAKPIVIGDNCWLAANVTVIGGVKIGSGCVIGAGSVVTRDIPNNYFAAGNPCKLIREIKN